MEHLDFYNDRKFCPRCAAYVPYLMSVGQSFCAECGGEVRLFSEEDWRSFNQQIEERKPKNGRGKKHSERKRRTA